MNLLIDTNILLRLADPGHVQRQQARSAVQHLTSVGHAGVLVPQVLYEFWVVATRPLEQNGLGGSTEQAARDVEDRMRSFSVLLDERGVFTRWHGLVATYQVKGKSAHDARLVAAMLRHGLTHVLTYNTADFSRYAGIQGVSPADVIAGTAPL